MMHYTTLNEIKKHNPCHDGWKKLLAALGKTEADDELVSLKFILESNGFDDALWALRAVANIDREARLFAVRCARQVQHLMTDQRSRDALDVAERFANGEATVGELDAASAAAWSAALATEKDPEYAAAKSAAWAASAAAWDASAAAWGATRAASRVAQKAKFIEMFCKEKEPK